ncbi:DUF4214 domain-containing protein [Sulfitobacter sp. AS92]|uniref:DUF4214 domain-containing protein n=1 Tax=Sulfitobacter sp. AS92 TaxID=3135783 RepID=UPI003178A50C
MPYLEDFCRAVAREKKIVNLHKAGITNMATSTQINAITALYVGYFDRAPDPAGLQFWIDQIDNGREFNTIAADFAASAEAVALYPYLTTPDVSSPAAFITNIYANLFGRTPDDEGLEFWTGVLEDGSVSVADMIEAIIMGARDDAAAGTFDKSVLDNKVEVGLDFALETGNVAGFEFDAAAKAAAVAAVNGVTEDKATVAQAKAATDAYVADGTVPGPGTVGDIFTLTAGVDQLTGTANNDTIRAVVNDSLESFDIIDGGAGNDVLNIADDAISSGAATTVVPVIKNVERINNGEDDTIDLQSVTGAKQIWTTGAAGTYTNAMLATAFGVSTAGSTANIAFADDLSGDSDAATFAADLAAAGAVTFEITADADAVETVNVSVDAVDAAAGGATTVNLDADLDGLQTVNVTGSGDAVIQSVGGTALAEATLEVFNASAATGDVDVDLTGSGDTASSATVEDLTVTMGSGDNMVTLAGQNDATVDLGAGDDTFVSAGAEQGLSLTLGAGNDLIDLSATTNIADAAEANFQSDIFKIADFNVDDDTLDVAGLTQIALTNVQQATIGSGAGDDLFDAVTDAATFTSNLSGNDEAVVFEFDGNTYLYTDSDDDGAFSATDGLIELTGISMSDLDASNFVI